MKLRDVAINPAGPCPRLMLAAVLLIPAVWPLVPEAGGADWRLIRQSSYGDASFYDASSVRRMEGQVVSLRARLGGSEFDYQMRCGKQEARVIEKGEADGQNGKWFRITGNSDEEIIYQAVCRD